MTVKQMDTFRDKYFGSEDERKDMKHIYITFNGDLDLISKWYSLWWQDSTTCSADHSRRRVHMIKSDKNWVPHEIRISLKWLLVLLIWINSNINNNNHLDYYFRVKVLAIVCYKYFHFRPWSASSVITSARELPNNHILRIICNLIPYLYGSSILF
jgi:hypothetical protein